MCISVQQYNRICKNICGISIFEKTWIVCTISAQHTTYKMNKLEKEMACDRSIDWMRGLGSVETLRP
jgi:hypothetical protein